MAALNDFSIATANFANCGSYSQWARMNREWWDDWHGTYDFMYYFRKSTKRMVVHHDFHFGAREVIEWGKYWVSKVYTGDKFDIYFYTEAIDDGRWDRLLDTTRIVNRRKRLKLNGKSCPCYMRSLGYARR